MLGRVAGLEVKRNVHFSEFFGVEAGRCRVYHGMINPRLNGNQTRVNC